MTALLRSRGSTSEMAQLFDAVAEPDLHWRATSWTGDRVPVVPIDGDCRRLTTMVWGLSERSFIRPVAAKQSGTLYPRDLSRSASRLSDHGDIQRCLILIESFAYADGRGGHCTCSWFGLWDEELTAWPTKLAG